MGQDELKRRQGYCPGSTDRAWSQLWRLCVIVTDQAGPHWGLADARRLSRCGADLSYRKDIADAPNSLVRQQKQAAR